MLERNYWKWKSTYNEHLHELYNICLNEFKDVKILDINYDKFCKLVYRKSSGYISPYI